MNSDNLNQSNNDAEIRTQLRASGEIPKHIAIIMDGNGRWAKKKGNLRVFGHKAGVESVRDIVEASAQIGVEFLTLFAFSTENWNRPGTEISALMQILVNTLGKEAKRLHKNNIRITTIGQTERFPKSCKVSLKNAMDLTAENTGMNLCLALSYSGRWDMVQATQSIANEVKMGKLDPNQINEELVSHYMATTSMVDPDLIIRTSGEYRISNFFLWQAAYSELYITPVLWPDFRRGELYKAIDSYQKRERRFGKTSEQITETLKK